VESARDRLSDASGGASDERPASLELHGRAL
jgi:hypothetical protein